MLQKPSFAKTELCENPASVMQAHVFACTRDMEAASSETTNPPYECSSPAGTPTTASDDATSSLDMLSIATSYELERIKDKKTGLPEAPGFQKGDEVCVKTGANVGDQRLANWYRGKVIDISQALYELNDHSRILLPCYRIQYKGSGSRHDEWLFGDALMDVGNPASRATVAKDNRGYKTALTTAGTRTAEKAKTRKKNSQRPKKTPKPATSGAARTTRSQLRRTSVTYRGKRPRGSGDGEQEPAENLPRTSPHIALADTEKETAIRAYGAKRIASDLPTQSCPETPSASGPYSVGNTDVTRLLTLPEQTNARQIMRCLDTDGGPTPRMSDKLVNADQYSTISACSGLTAGPSRESRCSSTDTVTVGTRFPADWMAAELDGLVRFKVEKAEEMRKLELKEKEAEWTLIRHFMEFQTQRDEQREREREERERKQKTYRDQLESLVRVLGDASGRSDTNRKD